MSRFDYLIVGAGLFGATFANTMAGMGKKVLVVERRSHVAGNAYTESVDGINVHRYGPHIFHCQSERIWKFVNRFASFHPYRHRILSWAGNRYHSFPVNLSTLRSLWGVRTPEEAANKLDEVRRPFAGKCDNAKEYALSQVGQELYETFIAGYTQKQWGVAPEELPASIVQRLPVRITEHEECFDDQYQGIPVGGYTNMVERMLDGVEVRLGVDFRHLLKSWQKIADKIVYSGRLDELLDFKYGELPHRSLRWETKTLPTNYQPVAQVNYPGLDVSYTRIIEHKHFELLGPGPSVVSWEYPIPSRLGNDPFYPVESCENLALHQKYKDEILARFPGIILGGRLADYRYYDMHQVIARSLMLTEREVTSTK